MTEVQALLSLATNFSSSQVPALQKTGFLLQELLRTSVTKNQSLSFRVGLQRQAVRLIADNALINTTRTQKQCYVNAILKIVKPSFSTRALMAITKPSVSLQMKVLRHFLKRQNYFIPRQDPLQKLKFSFRQILLKKLDQEWKKHSVYRQEVISDLHSLIIQINRFERLNPVELSNLKSQNGYKYAYAYNAELRKTQLQLYTTARNTFLKCIKKPWKAAFYSIWSNTLFKKEDFCRKTKEVVTILNYLGNREDLVQFFQRYFKEAKPLEPAQKINAFNDFLATTLLRLQETPSRQLKFADLQEKRVLLSSFSKKILAFADQYHCDSCIADISAAEKMRLKCMKLVTLIQARTNSKEADELYQKASGFPIPSGKQHYAALRTLHEQIKGCLKRSKIKSIGTERGLLKPVRHKVPYYGRIIRVPPSYQALSYQRKKEVVELLSKVIAVGNMLMGFFTSMMILSVFGTAPVLATLFSIGLMYTSYYLYQPPLYRLLKNTLLKRNFANGINSLLGKAAMGSLLLISLAIGFTVAGINLGFIMATPLIAMPVLLGIAGLGSAGMIFCWTAMIYDSFSSSILRLKKEFQTRLPMLREQGVLNFIAHFFSKFRRRWLFPLPEINRHLGNKEYNYQCKVARLALVTKLFILPGLLGIGCTFALFATVATLGTWQIEMAAFMRAYFHVGLALSNKVSSLLIYSFSALGVSHFNFQSLISFTIKAGNLIADRVIAPLVTRSFYFICHPLKATYWGAGMLLSIGKSFCQFPQKAYKNPEKSLFPILHTVKHLMIDLPMIKFASMASALSAVGGAVSLSSAFGFKLGTAKHISFWSENFSTYSCNTLLALNRMQERLPSQKSILQRLVKEEVLPAKPHSIPQTGFKEQFSNFQPSSIKKKVVIKKLPPPANYYLSTSTTSKPSTRCA